MMTTINISLPTGMYDDIKKVLAQKGYSSVSELVRDSLRDILYPTKTLNDFTPEFEDRVLEASKKPQKKDMTWNGKGSFTDFVLKHGKKRYG